MWPPSVAIYFYRLQRSCEGYVFTPVCHSVHRRGCLPQHMLGYHLPGAGTPLGPGTSPKQGPGIPPGPGTLKQVPPLEQVPPPSRSRDGYCCGWNASYWNAFLFMTYFYRIGGGHGPLGPLPLIRYCKMSKIQRYTARIYFSFSLYALDSMMVSIIMIYNNFHTYEKKYYCKSIIGNSNFSTK